MCLIDECVGDILEQYFLPEGYDRSKVTKKLRHIVLSHSLDLDFDTIQASNNNPF